MTTGRTSFSEGTGCWASVDDDGRLDVRLEYLAGVREQMEEDTNGHVDVVSNYEGGVRSGALHRGRQHRSHVRERDVLALLERAYLPPPSGRTSRLLAIRAARKRAPGMSSRP